MQSRSHFQFKELRVSVNDSDDWLEVKAQRIMEFFLTRSPCRIVVIDDDLMGLRETWNRLSTLVRKNGVIYERQCSFIVKKPNDDVSMIVGLVYSKNCKDMLYGHHIADEKDGVARTMAVIHSRDVFVSLSVGTWASVILLDEEWGRSSNPISMDKPIMVPKV